MKRFSRNTAILLMVATVLAGIFAIGTGIYAQGTDHYNSPLYSPKVYNPAETSSNGLPTALKTIGIEQKLGESLPLDAEFKNEDGQMVKLGSFFNQGRPIVLAFVYYECPMLCNEVLNGLTGSLKGMSLEAGKDFDVIAISFDKRENDKPELAKNKKASYVERYGHPGAETGWHFLTGTEESIDAATSAAGFSFKWDEKTEQFAHAGGIMVVTPDGRMSRYFYGIDYAPKDLKFGIMDSANEKIGNPAERLLLYCYHYDPATGTYGFAIMRMVRIGGALTILGMAAMGFVFWRKGKKRLS